MDSAHEIPCRRRALARSAAAVAQDPAAHPAKTADPTAADRLYQRQLHGGTVADLGSTSAVQSTLRTGTKGKVKVGEDCRLGLDP